MSIPLAETSLEFSGKFYKISKIAYTGAATTFKVDQSAASVAVLEPASGAPTATLGAGDANFEKTVTLAAGSSAGTVTVVVAHTGTLSSTKV